MRVGVFFGGQSREREISFAGGRTVYDNLNKSLFEPVPIFIDSLGNFILLDWEFIYKGTIRDFYPSTNVYPTNEINYQLYIESIESKKLVNQAIESIGRKVNPDEFSSLFDFAFLALHGPYGEDGNLQGMLEWYNIPYSGSGILPSAIGINKSIQKEILKNAGFSTPDYQIVSRVTWEAEPDEVVKDILTSMSFPLVIKAPNQGSSIGISIVKNQKELSQAIDKSFFIQKINLTEWRNKDIEAKRQWIAQLIDIREGTGLPAYINGSTIVHHPEQLIEKLDNDDSGELEITPLNSEEEVLIESFIEGREFSTIVIQSEEDEPLALPPTEIVKSKTLFDYRSKYLPGISRKVTPIDLPTNEIERIRKECERLYTAINSQVYARIDGFYTNDGKIYLNDPNTTSGMLPSSFFFHQAAEINLTPTDFLTYIIRTSLKARIKTGKRNLELRKLLYTLEEEITNNLSNAESRRKVAVIMGGFSSERHISVESGRNIFEKLNSTKTYDPIPVFLTGSEKNHELYVLPINVMLKDNADDIKEKVIEKGKEHEVISKIRKEAQPTIDVYCENNYEGIIPIDYKQLSGLVEFAFIALHGRPGEDGAIQQELEKYQIPYNGSGVKSSQTTINKAETNKILKANGILVANHWLFIKEEYFNQRADYLKKIEEYVTYPFIAKPADDGCSSAVKKINNQEELIAFANMIFRKTDDDRDPSDVKTLQLHPKEEFPIKSYFMIEDLISKNNANHFLEVTGGLLTKLNEKGEITYQVFEPSEALASGEILSLEEKFLAGEGQNITPARFSIETEKNKWVSSQVRAEFEKVAKIMNVEGYCRIDAFVRIFENSVETIIIEINSLPGMTPATCIFHQSAIADMKPYEFINEIINYGFNKTKKVFKPIEI